MASLQNAQIDQSYPALIKTDDNGPIGATAKAITDGAGNATNIEMSNTATNFVSGTVDFTGSTVSGLPAGSDTTYDLGSAQSTNDVDVTLTGSDATIDTIKMVAGTNITLTDNGSNQITIDAAGGGGAAGLVAGSGTDSMQSAASLTTNPSTVSGANTISLGDNNIADKPDLINIGTNLNNSGTGDGTIMIGKNWRQTFGEKSVLIGHNNSQISVGQCGVVAIGSVGCTDSRYGVIIGNGACAYGSSNGFGVAVGYNSAAGSGSATDQATALGYAAKASNLNSLALGAATIASADGATALGHGVTAAKADTVTVKELEVCAAGGGITIKSPNGTEYKLTVTDAGALVIT